MRRIDVVVGGRVRLRRIMLGLSQRQLGEAIGLTAQQLHKYETGANRVAAGILFRVASALDVPVSYFFDDVKARRAGPAADTDEASIRQREVLDLVRAYHQIRDHELRDRLLDFIRQVADRAEREPRQALSKGNRPRRNPA